MERALFWIGVILSFLIPLSAEAASSLSYDLRPGLVNARWEGKGTIAMQQTQNGILLTSGAGTGMFLTSEVPTFFAEAASLLVSATSASEIRFVWFLNADTFSSIPLDIPAGNDQPMSFSLRQNPEWTLPVRSIGILLPPHTSVLLNRVDFVRWSVLEKIGSAVTSFVTFDAYRPYSINFVWGPLFALNPIELHAVYRNLPPQQIYATYVLFWMLLAILCALGIYARFRILPGRRKAFVTRTFIGIAFAFWIIMDLRMGSEFLSWVHADHVTYIAAPASSREFRERGRFYDFAAFAKPYLYDRSSYVFFAEQQWPYLGNMRYLTYPAIPGISIDTDDTWVIYARPDLIVNEAGQITIDGEPVSPPGKILGRFDEGSFVFRTHTPPSAE